MKPNKKKACEPLHYHEQGWSDTCFTNVYYYTTLFGIVGTAG